MGKSTVYFTDPKKAKMCKKPASIPDNAKKSGDRRRGGFFIKPQHGSDLPIDALVARGKNRIFDFFKTL